MTADPSIRLAVAGTGAFGRQHLDALRHLAAVDVVAVADGPAEFDDVLARTDVDAVVLATPTPLHAAQAIAVLHAGKHVQVEIPLADSWADAQDVARAQRETGLVAMVGHTRRFNPPHRWLRRRIHSGELSLQQLAVQTYFLRRDNRNALGEPRAWTDNLLWHHAAHGVDLLRHQSGQEISLASAIAGPVDPTLGIVLDLVIQLRTTGGVVASCSLSFNNNGPLGTDFRYICDSGTFLARYDTLVSGTGEPVDVSGPGPWRTGVEQQDQEFVDAIRHDREPEASVASVLPSYRVLADLQEQLTGAR
jgi:2-hydroxy-4-carboxymuconate semialdehyde hemiacetal dehydrogenase